MSIAQDFFREVLRCPRAPRDLDLTNVHSAKTCLFRLLTNKQLQLHCDTVELAASSPSTDRALFAAYHRLYIATVEQIRQTYTADFIPWLDEPLLEDELLFLRQHTQDLTYDPDLITRHPDAPPVAAPALPLTQEPITGTHQDTQLLED
jgi:hypothetical protein